MSLHVNSLTISIDEDGDINMVVGIHVNKAQTCTSLILRLYTVMAIDHVLRQRQLHLYYVHHSIFSLVQHHNI